MEDKRRKLRLGFRETEFGYREYTGCSELADCELEKYLKAMEDANKKDKNIKIETKDAINVKGKLVDICMIPKDFVQHDITLVIVPFLVLLNVNREPMYELCADINIPEYIKSGVLQSSERLTFNQMVIVDKKKLIEKIGQSMFIKEDGSIELKEMKIPSSITQNINLSKEKNIYIKDIIEKIICNCECYHTTLNSEEK